MMRNVVFFSFVGLGLLSFLAGLPAFGEERAPELERDQTSRTLEAFDQGLSLEDRRLLKQVAPGERYRLTPRQRNHYDERQKLKEESEYWNKVVLLKRDLLRMPGGLDVREAEEIAKTAIQGFSDLIKKY